MDNLTACALAARKMGLSYGKYMALREGGTIVPKPVVELPVEDLHYCKECGKEFNPNNRLMVYCSQECKKNNHARMCRERMRKKSTITPEDVLICPWCKKEFVRGNRHGLAKYCSPECSLAARKEQQRRYTNG